jgi:hypothetical protein
MEHNMERFLDEPVELTEADLREVAGGWGECGCDNGIEIEVDLDVSLKL